MIKTLLRILGKTLGCLLAVVLLLVLVTGFSPIYRFRPPRPFSGPDIFNPYAALDTSIGWKRSLFHCHTRVKGPWPVNECAYDAQQTWDALQKLGYDIVTFSNHNEITPHPFDTALQVNVYEQGYSPYKFHKLVFGSSRVKHYDPLVPLLASQKQFELERLGAGSDFIQMNHPYRTWGTSEDHFQKLSGYEIMELDTSVSTENEYWDWALSAGHYCFGLANDDLHYPDRSGCIGVRCNFLCTPSGRYEDLKHTLLGGCYYAMRVPDYGQGDWAVKYERNRHLPAIRDIGLRGDTVYLCLSARADSIRATGQDHAVLALSTQTDSLAYVLGPEEPYVRLTAFFPDGEVIYTNPFARYDASRQASPLGEAPQPFNIPLTILWNLLLLLLAAGVLCGMVKLIRCR